MFQGEALSCIPDKTLLSLVQTRGQDCPRSCSVLFALIVPLSPLNTTRSLVQPRAHAHAAHLVLRLICSCTRSGTGAGMMLICSLGCRKLPGRICQNIRMVFLSTHTTFATEDGDLQDSPLALTLSQHVYLYKFPR